MRTRAFIVAVAVALGIGALSSSSGAGDEAIAVVVNPSVSAAKLSRDELKQLFQTRSNRLPSGEKADPVNLPQGSSARVVFDRVVLGMDPDEVARYWVDRKIRGGNQPPKKLPSTALVLRHVERTPGAVGYVPASQAKGARVVARIASGKVVTP